MADSQSARLTAEMAPVQHRHNRGVTNREHRSRDQEGRWRRASSSFIPAALFATTVLAFLASVTMEAPVAIAMAMPQTPDHFPPLGKDQEQLNSQRLVGAIRVKDWEGVRQLLPRVRNLNEALDAGLLTAAAEANRNDILFYLLDDRDVDPNLRTAGGDQKTALMHAAEGSNLQGVEKLLEAGAEPELIDSGNWTALHYAAKDGNADVVSRLVNFVDARLSTTDGHTPLHLAAQFRHPEVVDVLCLAADPKPNPNAENELQQTPLRLGCCETGGSEQDVAVLAALLERCGADPNRPDYLNRTPLHYAASSGALAATQLLIKAGANPLIEDAMEETPRELAKRGNHMDVAKVLRSAEKDYAAMVATSTTSTSTTFAPPRPTYSKDWDEENDEQQEEEEQDGGAQEEDGDKDGEEVDNRPGAGEPERTVTEKAADEGKEESDKSQGNAEPETDDGGDATSSSKEKQRPSQPAKKNDNQPMFNWIQYFAPFFFG